jgi:hypothetical protein
LQEGLPPAYTQRRLIHAVATETCACDRFRDSDPGCMGVAAGLRATGPGPARGGTGGCQCYWPEISQGAARVPWALIQVRSVRTHVYNPLRSLSKRVYTPKTKTFAEARKELKQLESLLEETSSLPSTDARARLVSLRDQLVHYENHFSAVRSGISTFLLGIGISIGAFFIHAREIPLSLSLPALLFLFAVLVNFHFQRLTFACRYMQDAIDHEISAIAPHGEHVLKKKFIMMRRQLELLIRTGQIRYYLDAPGKLLLFGIVLYGVLAMVSAVLL